MYRQEYLQKIEGEYSEEKQAYLEKESERLIGIIAKKNEMADAYSEKIITDEEYSAYIQEMTVASYRQPVVGGLLDKAENFDERFELTGRSRVPPVQHGIQQIHEPGGRTICFCFS